MAQPYLGTKSMRVNSGGPRIAPAPVADPILLSEECRALGDIFDKLYRVLQRDGRLRRKVWASRSRWKIIGVSPPIPSISGSSSKRSIILSVKRHPTSATGNTNTCSFHGLQDLAPYAHTNVHAKYWDRWKNPDVQRNVRIMLNANYTGIFALEYEDGPWD